VNEHFLPDTPAVSKSPGGRPRRPVGQISEGGARREESICTTAGERDDPGVARRNDNGRRRARLAAGYLAHGRKQESPVGSAEHGNGRRRSHGTSTFLTHPIFKQAPLRDGDDALHPRPRGAGDIGLDTSMIPLGLVHDEAETRRSEMLRSRGPEFSWLHPFRAGRPGAGGLRRGVPRARGRCSPPSTGFAGPCPLQPNSGAQAGRVRRADGDPCVSTAACGETNRDVGADFRASAAQGPNPASCRSWPACASSSSRGTAEGNIDVEDLKRKAREHKKQARGADGHVSVHATACSRKTIQDCLPPPCTRMARPGCTWTGGEHERAGWGLTSPAAIGADVCHNQNLAQRTFRQFRTAAAVPGHGTDSASLRIWRRICPGIPVITDRRQSGAISTRLSAAPVGQREHPADSRTRT